MFVSIIVHVGILVRIKIFSPRSYIDSYSMYNKAACARSKHDDHDDDKINTLAFVNFLLVKIFPTLICQYFPTHTHARTHARTHTHTHIPTSTTTASRLLTLTYSYTTISNASQQMDR